MNSKLLPFILVISGLSVFVFLGWAAIVGRNEVRQQLYEDVTQQTVSLSSICECSVLTFDDLLMHKILPDGTNQQLFEIQPADGVGPMEYVIAVSPSGGMAIIRKNNKIMVKNTNDEKTIIEKNEGETLRPVVASWSGDESTVAWAESEPYDFISDPSNQPVQQITMATLPDKKIISIPKNNEFINIQKIIVLDHGQGILVDSYGPDNISGAGPSAERKFWFWTTDSSWRELTLPRIFLAESIDPISFIQLSDSSIIANNGKAASMLDINSREFTLQKFTPWSPYFIARSPSGKIYGLIDDPDVAYGRLVELNDDFTEKHTIITKFTLGDGFASMAWVSGTERIVIRDQSVDKAYTADLSLSSTQLQPLLINGYVQTLGRIVGLLN